MEADDCGSAHCSNTWRSSSVSASSSSTPSCPSSGTGSSGDCDASSTPEDEAAGTLHVETMRTAKRIMRIGKGAFGKVHLVECKLRNGKRVQLARKTVQHDGCSELTCSLEWEVKAARAAASSPFAVRFWGVLEYPDRTELFYDYAKRGSLEDRLDRVCKKLRKSKEPQEQLLLPVAELQRIAFCTLNAVAAMNANGMAHLDIKPANILVGGSGSYLLADMGNAQELDANGQLSGFLGTPGYVAPEQYKCVPYALNADTYSVGALMCIAGVWHSNPGSLIDYQDGECSLPDFVPDQLRNFIELTMAADPAERPSPAAALAHPFLAYLRAEGFA